MTGTGSSGGAGAPDDPGIEGVTLVSPPTFPDDRGAVYRMLRRTDDHFPGFGEIYFSSVYEGVVKAWKRHRSLVGSYVCVHGRVRMVLYDDREKASSRGTLAEIEMGPDRYRLVVVPPGVWNGFVGLASPVSVMANCASEVYDPAEFDRIDPHDERIPYRWASDRERPVGEGHD